MVRLGRVSRSGFYRFQNSEPSPGRDMDLRDAIQRIALEWPSYGRPRITKELRNRGWRVNPKRVYRLMREDNLLCVIEEIFEKDNMILLRLQPLGRHKSNDAFAVGRNIISRSADWAEVCEVLL
jgi:hypothetical protein